MKKLMVLLLCTLALNACSTPLIKSRDNEYLQAKALPALKTPEGVSNTQLGEDYPVTGNINVGNKAPSLIPPGSLAASSTK